MSSPVKFILCLLVLLLGFAIAPATVRSSTQTLVDKAVVKMQQKHYGEALTILHDLEQRLSDPAQVSGLIGTAYLGLGYQHLNRRQYEEALSAFAAGHEYAEADMRLWLGEGIAGYHLGQYAIAENALQQAIGIDGNSAQAYLTLGQVYYVQGALYDAMQMLERAQELGDGERVQELLSKVRREWEIEQDMDRDLEGMFQISFADDRQSRLAGDVLHVLNDAYTELGAQLNYFPDVKVEVLLYTRQDFSAVTRSPDWAGAVYDGKIRIPLGGIRQMSAQLKGLLYHEYAHVLIRYLGKGRVPTWLNEGFAELAGRWFYDKPLEQFDQAVVEGHLLPWEALNKRFAELPSTEVPLAYEQSYSMTAYLVEQFGWYNFHDLLAMLGQGESFDAAMASAYEEFGVGWAEIQSEWRTAHNLGR